MIFWHNYRVISFQEDANRSGFGGNNGTPEFGPTCNRLYQDLGSPKCSQYLSWRPLACR